MASDLSVRRPSHAYLNASPCCFTAVSTTSRSDRNSRPTQAKTSPRLLTAASTTSLSARKTLETYGSTEAFTLTAASTKLLSDCSEASANWKASLLCFTAIKTSSRSDFSSEGTSHSIMPRRPTLCIHMACCEVLRTSVNSRRPPSLASGARPLVPVVQPIRMAEAQLSSLGAGPARASTSDPDAAKRTSSVIGWESSRSAVVPNTSLCLRVGTPVKACRAFLMPPSVQCL
mmetsp:Transcript_140468/g.436759  ORF Transcript_140468/g.436759 Transcript_140468/m.436759 type:complete len:231 (-) Transcript_140468:175-867(-)